MGDTSIHGTRVESGSTDTGASDAAVNNDTQPNATSVLDDDASGEGQTDTGTVLDSGVNDDGKSSDDGNDDKAVMVPEKYEPFEMPEGITMTDETFEGFSGLAKELNLSQEQAQKLVTFQSDLVTAQQKQSFDDNKKIIDDWKSETIKMMGPDAGQYKAIANRVLDARPELKQILLDTGLVNNSQVMKFIVDHGKLTSEDTGVDGQTSGSKKTREEKMYGK